MSQPADQLIRHGGLWNETEPGSEKARQEKPAPETTAVETQTKKAVRRRAYVPGLLKAFQKTAEESAAKIGETSQHEAQKLGKIAAAIDEAIRMDQGNVEQDDERVRAIINTATGGGVERMLRHAPILEESDNREFLRSKKWRV